MMSEWERFQRAVDAANLGAVVQGRNPLSGGCIDEVARLTLDDGSSLAAKRGRGDAAARFREEIAGLSALAETETVLVPRPITLHEENGEAVLLMSYLEPAPATRDGWERFGNDLADLHACDVGRRYGFDSDNHLGSTPQINTWHDDWIEFNRSCRFGHQLRLARDRGHLDEMALRDLESFIDRLDEFIPAHPHPALLHGDLWSGNAMPVCGGRIAVIDPAVSIGDGWADIAMMKLFGGFPPACLEAYAARAADRDRVEQRIAVYQVYHLLNHVNIFGGGYLAQTMSVVRTLLRS